jgi:hypothetical protein
MLSNLRKRVVTAASTQRPAAVAVGFAVGAWGALRGRRGSADQMR